MTGAPTPSRPLAPIHIASPIVLTHPTPHAIAPTPSIAATPRHTSVIDPFFGRALTAAEQSYVREFSGWSVSRLEKEPRLLAAEGAQLQREIEELSLKNYPTFLQTNTVLKQSDKNLQQIDRRMNELHATILPNLQSACEAFLDRSVGLMAQAESHRNMVKQQNFLLELLEIPSLMDTCFKSATAPTTNEREKNKLINDALQLDQYVRELIEQQVRSKQNATSGSAAFDPSDPASHPSVPPILLSIQSEMSLLKRNIVNHLLQQLRGNISAQQEEEELPPSAIAAGKRPAMITIPEVVVGIRIVGLLKRTMEMFGQGEATHALAGQNEHAHIFLKYQFLHARNAFFDSVLNGLNKPSLPSGGIATTALSSTAPPTPSAASPSSAIAIPGSSLLAPPLNLQVFKYLDEYVSLHRTHLFNITTLYSALFLDHDDVAGAGVGAITSPATSPSSSFDFSATDGTSAGNTTNKQAEDLGILCRWIHMRFTLFLSTLSTFLPYLTDGSSIHSLLSSTMSCASGLARSKVGLDFRGLVAPLFERHVESVWDRSLSACITGFDQSLRDYPWFIREQQLKRFGFNVTATTQPTPKQSVGVEERIQEHLKALLEYPPLAILSNGLISSINELSKCAPLSISGSLGALAEKHAEQLVQKLKNTQHMQQGAGITQSATTVASSLSTPSTTSGTHDDAANGATSTTIVSEPIVQLAHGVHDHLLPLVDALLKHVYRGVDGLFHLSRLQQSLSVMFEDERLEASRRAAAEVERKRVEEIERQRKEMERVQEEKRQADELQRAQAQALELAAPQSTAEAVGSVDEPPTHAEIDLDLDAALAPNPDTTTTDTE